MKSFLCIGKRPLIRWGSLPDETYYEGDIPEGFTLAVSPSKGFIVVDIDVDKDKNGFTNIPYEILREMYQTLMYSTKRGGAHVWLKYTGEKELGNKTSKYSIDLRTHKGYVIYYPDNDIRDQLHLVKESSPEMNIWLEELFSYV